MGMDIWEANMVATAFTPHPAEKAGLNVCMGDEECGRQDGDRFISPTDRDGCDVNAYRMGDKTFYGPGPEFQVNTQQPFKVVTRFHAPSGVLEGIEQFYVQNGKEIHHPKHAALGNTNIETDESCAAQKEAFGDRAPRCWVHRHQHQVGRAGLHIRCLRCDCLITKGFVFFFLRVSLANSFSKQGCLWETSTK